MKKVNINDFVKEKTFHYRKEFDEYTVKSNVLVLRNKQNLIIKGYPNNVDQLILENCTNIVFANLLDVYSDVFIIKNCNNIQFSKMVEDSDFIIIENSTGINFNKLKYADCLELTNSKNCNFNKLKHVRGWVNLINSEINLPKIIKQTDKTITINNKLYIYCNSEPLIIDDFKPIIAYEVMRLNLAYSESFYMIGQEGSNLFAEGDTKEKAIANYKKGYYAY